ncbi:TPA: hypothetical protein HA244_02340 [Candidatus Micrarchaeota archaeon]|nr:hypothetical protein [Candidatus Micrarchaeota archaeon]
MKPRIVVKKREGEAFSEISFAHPEHVSSEGKQKEQPPQPKVQEPAAKGEERKVEEAHEGEAYTASETEKQLAAAKAEDEAIVGLNRLTQKPIIKSVKKKPVIKNVEEKPSIPNEDAEPLSLTDEGEKMAEDIAAQELRHRQLRDITPVSNSPTGAKPRETKERARAEAVDLARRIWSEQEQKRPLHKKLLRRLGLR